MTINLTKTPENNIKQCISIIKMNYNIKYLDKINDYLLVSCSNKQLIIFKINLFEIQYKLTENLNNINSFTILEDKRIIICLNNGTMKIIKLKEKEYIVEEILKGHSHSIMKVIEFKKNKLASISEDNVIKIWELKNNENKFFPIYKIVSFFSDYSFYNIIKINENEFVTSSTKEKYLKFYESQNFSNISTINNIEMTWTFDSMCLLNKNLVCVGGINFKGFYIIQISNHQLIKNIVGPKIIWSIIKCRDDLFLCSLIDKNGNKSLIKYEFKDFDFKPIFIMENAHNNNIYSITEINGKLIASGGSDQLIKIWGN